MSITFHGNWAISRICFFLKRGISLANLLRLFLQFSNEQEIFNPLGLKIKSLLRTSSEVHPASIWIEQLTDTINDIEQLSWSSCSSSGCWLIVKIGFFSLRINREKIQVGEVRNWGGGLKKFSFVEMSRWNVTSKRNLWTCTGYLYPCGHVSLQFRTRANWIYLRANRVGWGWFRRWGFFRWNRI